MSSELTKFLGERESDYRRLEDLLRRAEHGGLRRFDRIELVEFGHLYRLAAADLARARYVLKSPLLSEYLNEIVGRAHHLIHRKRAPILKSFIKFVAYEFPSTVRKEIRPILLATALLLGASLIGGIAYRIDPQWGQLIMSQPDLRNYERMVEQNPEQTLATAINTEQMASMSAYIITNNIQVCLYAIAGGLLFGLGTLYALTVNGFVLGVVGTMFLSRGPSYNLYFWSGILPHGVLEIPAICIAGGIGFLFARGLLIPGSLSRGDSLRREGRNAMKLLGGVILTLILAGLIEGFVTPAAFNILPAIKIFFAILLFAGYIFYLSRIGYRKDETVPEDEYERVTTHLRLE
jgi:uncharacterized membrane protein SpoIIM required for sporulation